MILLSLLINTLLFFVLVNLSYIQKKRGNPEYPDKPFTQTVLFPLSLGIVFTMIIDQFRGIMFYQLAIFLVIALLLYWIFFVIVQKDR